MAKTPDNIFGKRLAAHRVNVLGFTNAEQLASALKVSTGTVRGWEQGTSLPVGEPVWRLFHLLGPELFADLMPHLQDEATTIPVGEEGESRATIVALRGSKPQRLAHLVRVAEELARESDQ